MRTTFVASLLASAALLTGCASTGDAGPATSDANARSTSPDDGQSAEARAAALDQSYEEPAEPGLKLGQKIPANVALTSADGETVILDDLLDRPGPAVVMFYRGNWCPYCRSALDNWQDHIAEFEQAGAEVIAISPEGPGEVAQTIRDNDISYTVLSDATGEAARAFKVQFTLDQDTRSKYKGYGIDLAKHNASNTWNLPAPATFVIDDRGVVRYAFADWDYLKRSRPTEVLAAVRDAR